ncbi:Pan/apple-like domain-containing protein [Pandoravirus kuranda]|uniref:Pan/apple-like domain-containing protein n=1 Tax=Pandoravirus kuranda TaxID=3019033 RepID=A0AA95J6E7_9VIRU|nr:Pan/apple-like domain-containing protein [Pandoravirus kuranda]
MNAPVGANAVGSAKPVAAAPLPAKLVPPSAAKPAVVTAKETTVVVPAAPTAPKAAIVVAPPAAGGQAATVPAATLPPALLPQEATAPKPKGLWGIPTWVWIAIGVVLLLIVLAIVGEFVIRRRGGGGGGGTTSTYTLVANSNPVCDIADNKCDVASGTNEVSAEACKARCDRVSGCEGVLYDRSGLLGGANCWVKRFNTSPPKTDAWTGADFYYKKTATA